MSSPCAWLSPLSTAPSTAALALGVVVTSLLPAWGGLSQHPSLSASIFFQHHTPLIWSLPSLPSSLLPVARSPSPPSTSLTLAANIPKLHHHISCDPISCRIRTCPEMYYCRGCLDLPLHTYFSFAKICVLWFFGSKQKHSPAPYRPGWSLNMFNFVLVCLCEDEIGWCTTGRERVIEYQHPSSSSTFFQTYMYILKKKKFVPVSEKKKKSKEKYLYLSIKSPAQVLLIGLPTSPSPGAFQATFHVYRPVAVKSYNRGLLGLNGTITAVPYFHKLRLKPSHCYE